MRYSGKQIVHPGVRARDLPALMELYELNYIQLRQLVPDVRILNGGTGATTRVLIDFQDGVRTWTTVGASPNIIEASWRALSDSMEYALLSAWGVFDSPADDPAGGKAGAS